jgi:hypothetical protein
VRRAEALGCRVSLSVYTDAKNGNRAHLVRGEQGAALDGVPDVRAHRLQRVLLRLSR